MLIIPAIDIIEGKVVRLEQGKFDKCVAYSEDPVSVARKWKNEGAELLHIVDLDGARTGHPRNISIMSRIVKDVGIGVEFGGGLRGEEDIEAALEEGASYVVIGTKAVEDSAFCKRIISRFGKRIIFAVDVKDNKLAVKGWKEITDENILDYLRKLEKTGASSIIYTDISKDGMMSGPNLAFLKTVLNTTKMTVTASGGICTKEDIKTLRGIGKSNLRGAILGKALYEGKINLSEAIDAGKKNNTLS